MWSSERRAYLGGAATSVVCSLLLLATHPTYAMTRSDVLYRVFTTCAGGLYAALAAWRAPQLCTAASLHALDALVVILYGTPETPFGGIIAVVVCARAWSALLTLYSPSTQPSAAGLLELALTCAHGALLAELCVRPQLSNPHTWHAVVQTTLFVTYVWARFRVA